MASLLFSPRGRIGPGAYLKGSIIIGVISALLTLTGYVNVFIFFLALLFIFILTIPFIFINVKRAHDAGRSGWMSLVAVLISFIVFNVINLLLTLLGLAPSTAEQKESEARLEEIQSGADPTEMMAVLTDVMGPMILPLAITFLLTPIVTALLVNLFTKSDNHENQFGPATIGDS